MTFNFNKIWYGVRWYQESLAKRFYDNTIKDNIPLILTSLDFAQNDGINIVKFTNNKQNFDAVVLFL